MNMFEHIKTVRLEPWFCNWAAKLAVVPLVWTMSYRATITSNVRIMMMSFVLSDLTWSQFRYTLNQVT